MPHTLKGEQGQGKGQTREMPKNRNTMGKYFCCLPLPRSPRIEEADVALATLLMAAARHERTTQQWEGQGRVAGEGGKKGTTERHTDPVRGEHVLVVNRKHSRGRAKQPKRTCALSLSLCQSLSLSLTHTHTHTLRHS